MTILRVIGAIGIVLLWLVGVYAVCQWRNMR